MIDFLLVMGLGFLGSFGHCVGMCGPITVALALGHNRD
ncbi:MAG: sulfite exporter TauE/SafE family protein, partial [Cyanobacteria bacterium P01_D01_bin.128]